MPLGLIYEKQKEDKLQIHTLTFVEYAAYLLPIVEAYQKEFDSLDRKNAPQEQIHKLCDVLFYNSPTVLKQIINGEDYEIEGGVNSHIGTYFSSVAYAIFDLSNEIPDKVLNQDSGWITEAIKVRARRQAILDAKIAIADAPTDITLDDLEWEPVYNRMGRGLSEVQHCRAWVKGRYIVWKTWFPSPYDSEREITEKFCVYVGKNIPDNVGEGVATEQIYDSGSDEVEYSLTFPTAESAFDWCMLDHVDVFQEDYYPVEAKIVKGGKISYRKIKPKTIETSTL